MTLERALASNLSWIPVLAATILPVTFTITYGWSVGLGLVDPWFPTISNTGAYPPVSCFFSLMLSIESCVLFIAVYLRHKQLMDHYEHDYDKTVNIPRHSAIAMYIGVVACIGLLIVGNFQSVNVPLWHSFGGAMAFFVGTVYMAYQTFLSYKCEVSLTKRFNSHFRVFCTVGATLMIISMLTNMLIYNILEEDEPVATTVFPDSSSTPTHPISSPTSYTTPYTTPAPDKAAPFIVASAVSEWLIALFLVFFIYSLTPEFRRIRFLEIVFEMNYGRRSTAM